MQPISTKPYFFFTSKSTLHNHPGIFVGSMFSFVSLCAEWKKLRVAGDVDDVNRYNAILRELRHDTERQSRQQRRKHLHG